VGKVVVYVHGLWLTGGEAAGLCRRLAEELQAETKVFSYRSVVAGVAANAQALFEFLGDTAADELHLVGHSLGGLLILKLFERHPPPAPGRIVLLGSPLLGSRAAQNLARLPFGKRIMGQCVGDELLTPHERHWGGSRDLGIIAGDLSFGLGRLVGRFGTPNDGTVAVEETRLQGATEHMVLHASHFGMLFSPVVAQQAAAFLRAGRFDR